MLVVNIQSDLLSEAKVRVCVPLFPLREYGSGAKYLNPEIPFGDSIYVLMTEYTASLTLKDMGERVGSLGDERDRIIRAIDTLIGGV